MLNLLRRARRRLLANELLREGTNALSAALLAFILLLLLGTQVLNWRWALPIPLAAAAMGLWRARRRLPSPYGTAQIVDRRLGLADTLSTAFFFSKEAPPREAVEWQRAHAERVSRSVDVRKAIPYTMPRTAYLLGALFLVASSLFALRYAVTRRLDLKPPLARILQFDLRLGGHGEEEARAKLPDPPPPAPGEQAADEGDSRQQSRDARPEGGKQANPDDTADAAKKMNGGKRSQDGGTESRQDPAPATEQDGQSQASAKEGQNAAGASRPDASGADRRQSGGAQQNASGESSSLANRFKDAVQNLLSRMRPQQGAQGAKQRQESAQNGNQGNGSQDGSRQQADRNGQQSGRQGEGQQGDADRMAEDSPGSRGKAAGTGDQQNSKQPGSGIGNQDGNKDIKQAEQLAAMGKISEILGRRSANLSGEVTVEVQSSKQQLRTPYTVRDSQHAQAGVEIGRDEVPLALQQYVEQYFEQVRKTKK